VEDNDRVKEKEGLVIMPWRKAGQQDFCKEITAHTMWEHLILRSAVFVTVRWGAQLN